MNRDNQAFELRADGYWWAPPLGVGELLDFPLDFTRLITASDGTVDPISSVAWTLTPDNTIASKDLGRTAFTNLVATLWLNGVAAGTVLVKCSATTAAGRVLKPEFKLKVI